MATEMLKSGGKQRQYLLQDVTEPELYREMFPYDEVPRFMFDGVSVPMALPEDFWITDTTFRDGQQSRPPYTVEQVVDLYELLHRLDGHSGLIRACEYFLYTEKDKEAVRRCLERRYKYPEVTGWIRAVKSDFALVREMGLKETGVLTSASDYHIFLKLKKTRKQVMEDYLAIVKEALSHNIRVRCHLEDITRADIYGFCIPFAQEVMKLAEESRIPIKLRLCDTMGYGLPNSQATLPRSVPKLMYAFMHHGGVPSHLLEWHGHNDFHRVHVNSVTAWLYGCSGVNSSLLGFGERTGNSPLEALVVEYLSLKPDAKGIDTTVITEIGEYFRNQVRAEIPTNYPFVGEDFNTTRAGIHADGVIKNEEIYNIFNTTKLLNRPLEVDITDKSGVAGIAHWVNRHLPIKGAEPVDKRHQGIAKINAAVLKEYEAGRNTSMSNDELYKLAERNLPEYFESDFDWLKKQAKKVAKELIGKLADHALVRSMDAAKMLPLLQQAEADDPYIQLIAVVNTEGKMVALATAVTDKAKYKAALGDDFSDREWFIQPMKNGKVAVSDLYTSRITGVLCITVSAPVTNDAGVTVGVIELDIKFEELVKARG